MRRLLLTAVTVAAIACVLTPSASPARDDKAVAAERIKWVEESLKQMQTVKVGMTRAELLKVFAEEGGISTRTQQTYVYRGCQYFKVDVRFEPVGARAAAAPYPPGDKIVNISKPYLDWGIAD
jgi:hypothetical protein